MSGRQRQIPGRGVDRFSKNVPSSSWFPDATGVLDAKLVSDDYRRLKHGIGEQVHDLEGDLCRHFGEAVERVSDRSRANGSDEPWPFKTEKPMRSTAQDGVRRLRVCPVCSSVVRRDTLFHHTELRCLCKACNVVQENANALCLA